MLTANATDNVEPKDEVQKSSFEVSLGKTIRKHSYEYMVRALTMDIFDIVAAKKDYIQSELLKDPRKEVFLMFKRDLSRSYMITKLIGQETYPYYVNGTLKSNYFDSFGHPLAEYHHLRNKIAELIEISVPERICLKFRTKSFVEMMFFRTNTQ